MGGSVWTCRYSITGQIREMGTNEMGPNKTTEQAWGVLWKGSKCLLSLISFLLSRFLAITLRANALLRLYRFSSIVISAYFVLMTAMTNVINKQTSYVDMTCVSDSITLSVS